MIKKGLSNHHAVLWCIFALGFLLRGYGLSDQPPLDAEASAASAASNYLATGNFGQVMWYHPPFRNIVVFLSGELFGGYSAWGLRGGSVLLGSLTVPALGYLAYDLFKDKRISALAALFLCIDPLHISLSREAFQETTTAFFIVAGSLSAYLGIVKNNIAWCYLSGALFGIAASSKWHGIFPWAVSALAYVAAPWFMNEHQEKSALAPRLLAVLAAYVAVPTVIYVSIYVPWLYRGYGLDEFVQLQRWLLKHQYFYKGTSYTEDVLSHSAYQWFLWPVAWADFVFHKGKAYLNLAYGNYLVWVLTLPALVMTAKQWLKDRSFAPGFTIVLFLASYLPLILTTRSIWVFAAPAVIPFAFLLSAYAVIDLLDTKRISNRMLAMYLAAALCVTAVLYPLATFKALEYTWAKPLTEMYSPHGEQTR